MAELSAQEVQETEGGFVPLLVAGVAFFLLNGCSSTGGPGCAVLKPIAKQK